MTCESCGADEARLMPVHRIYLTAGDGGGSQVQTDVEEWCLACCTQYPHQPFAP